MTGRILLLVAFALGVALPAAPAQAAVTTVVSLTFDDGHWSHYEEALPILQSRGAKGTFYLNTGQIPATCPPGEFCWNMTWPQAEQMHAAGQEMGGHTLTHADLTAVTTAEARRQICDDRSNLLAHGFPAVSFAYPYSATNTTVQGIVRDCGYTSARVVGGFPNGVYAETIPPPNPYAVRTPVTNNSLSELQTAVMNAENNGGGWVPINFHEVCDCPDAPSRVTPATLAAFIDWLQLRSGNGTVIKTAGEAMGFTPGPSAPTTVASCDAGSCSAAWYRSTPVSVTLTATDRDGDLANTFYTTNGSDPAASGNAARQTYVGAFLVNNTSTVRFYSIDGANQAEPTKTQQINIDAALPAVNVTNPTNGASVKRGTTLTVTAVATDNGTGGAPPSGVAKVEFYRDGALVYTDTTGPYQFLWNTKGARVGSHTVSAVATDVAGNSTSSATITFKVVR